MTRFKQLTILTASVFCLGILFPACGAETNSEEKAISVSEVPQTLRSKVEKAVPGIRFTGAETEKYQNEKAYELQGYAGNHWHEILISPNGKILRAQVEDEDDEWEGKEIKLSQMPPAVRKAAEKAVPGIKLSAAETASGIYELEGCANGFDYEIKTTGNGDILQIIKEKRGFFRRLFDALF